LQRVSTKQSDNVNIYLNEKPQLIGPETTAGEVRDLHKPDADLMICNGFPIPAEQLLQEGDRLVLIRRGEIPPDDELEALLTARHTPGVHAKVKQATIGIAGVGGLGSAVSIALARIGIGRLIIADFDVVEPSNLNRQQFFLDQIGLPKVAALRDNLQRINRAVQVEPINQRLTSENIPALFAEADILVECFDLPDQKAMLTESWRSHYPDRPLVAASGLAGYDSSNSITTRRAGMNFYLVGDLETDARPGRGLMAPRVGIAAHHQANAVMRLILGVDPAGE